MLCVDVSIVSPVHNASAWIEECMQSVYEQEFDGTLEFCVHFDACTDDSEKKVLQWVDKLLTKEIVIKTSHTEDNNASSRPMGVGYSRNKAVLNSSGKYLCFLDADDVMMKDRIQQQYNAAILCPDCIIGSKFHRYPSVSTERFSNWANNLTAPQLYTQRFTSHGPTVIMPTWFLSRETFDRVGGFDEGGKGVPEDLIFYYKHLSLGGKLHRVDSDLLLYRYHPFCSTFSVAEETIWKHRVTFLECQILNAWQKFTIWNAGKQGRRLYRSLSDNSRTKVLAFCDVDEKKIQKSYYTFQESKLKPKPRVPIVHFSDIQPPVVICFKLDMTRGEFEKNLASMNFIEGIDFYHFN